MTGTPTQIEIFGLPGVGKTYLTDKLAARYPDIAPYILQNRPATRTERLYDVPYYLSHPYLIYGARKQKRRQALFTCFKRIARRRPFIGAHPYRLLVECGLLQPMLEAYLFWDRRAHIAWMKLFGAVIKPYRHYFLVSDTHDRIVQRELDRAPRQLDMDRAELVQKYREAQDLIAHLTPRMSVQEFSIPAYSDTDALVDDLYYNTMQFVRRWTASSAL